MFDSPETDPILCVCLNPVLQKTLVYERLVKGEVNRAREHRVDASGKGVNVARVLVETGRRAVHLTQAGGPTREWFLSLCAADGLEVEWVESGSEIRFCHTIVDLSDASSTELVEEARPVDSGTGERLLEIFRGLVPRCRALVVSGTKAAGFGDEVIPSMVSIAKAAGLPVVLDIKGRDLLSSLRHRPEIVKPNIAELLATWPPEGGLASVSGEASLRAHVERVARELRVEFGSTLVVTRGSLPVWHFGENELRDTPIHPIVPLNATGSGDAFTAGLAAAMVEGMDIGRAVAEGALLGARNARSLKPGSVAGISLD